MSRPVIKKRVLDFVQTLPGARISSQAMSQIDGSVDKILELFEDTQAGGDEKEELLHELVRFLQHVANVSDFCVLSGQESKQINQGSVLAGANILKNRVTAKSRTLPSVGQSAVKEGIDALYAVLVD
ncbi:uncharacterized protein LOC122363220 [Amphibalanus amphitrite]|uniref:uncharacterized protein LOC122363220 n=1 Tax=Amphibalanus amphitrite TaxID=1232801 RepID=UPI001C8FF268|nr:uncharacterized protein LOC122363220 [Amphibalanus amphitrite]